MRGLPIVENSVYSDACNCFEQSMAQQFASTVELIRASLTRKDRLLYTILPKHLLNFCRFLSFSLAHFAQATNSDYQLIDCHG